MSGKRDGRAMVLALNRPERNEFRSHDIAARAKAESPLHALLDLAGHLTKE